MAHTNCPGVIMTTLPNEENQMADMPFFDDLQRLLALKPRNRFQLECWINQARQMGKTIDRTFANYMRCLNSDQLMLVCSNVKLWKKQLQSRIYKLYVKRKQWDNWIEFLQNSFYPSMDIELNLEQFVALHSADFDHDQDEVPPLGTGIGFSDVHLQMVLSLIQPSNSSK